MKLFLSLLFISFLAKSHVLAQDPNLEIREETRSIPCTNCADGELTDIANQVSQMVHEAATCPENVKQIRLLMTSSYGSCDATVRFDSEMMATRAINLITGGRGNRLPSNCHFGRGNNCALLSDDAIEDHPYNRLAKCDPNLPKCNINGRSQPCPSFFYLGRQGRENPLDTPPYAGRGARQGGRLDPSQERYRSRDKNQNEFVGWNCSEYVTTAMKLSGLKMSTCNDDNKNKVWWTVQKMSDAANKRGQFNQCSCMNVVDLSDPNEKLKPGDILLYGGHAMMIEAADEDFMGKLTNPTLPQGCGNNVNACIDQIKDKCSVENINPNDLQFRINHASDSFGGIGASSMNYADYQSRDYNKAYNTIRHFAKVNQKVTDLFEETNGFERGFEDYSPLSLRRLKLAYELWKKGDMLTQSFFEIFLKDNVERLNLSDREKAAYRDIDKMNRESEDISSLRMSSSWQREREHMSNLCQARLCKKHDELKNNRHCKAVSDLANTPQTNSSNRFFQVIRHNGSDSCKENNPPKLKHACGHACNGGAGAGCAFSTN